MDISVIELLNVMLFRVCFHVKTRPKSKKNGCRHVISSRFLSSISLISPTIPLCGLPAIPVKKISANTNDRVPVKLLDFTGILY
ncbi:MAG: hypothetical protein K9I71_12690 [Ignavibacteriales bacterium]|nr:hypothetical protein [Ignavibacteriales bacterium]MCF8438551.1 hypothetical protein [Ignavibacteriales bacterium]